MEAEQRGRKRRTSSKKGKGKSSGRGAPGAPAAVKTTRSSFARRR